MLMDGVKSQRDGGRWQMGGWGRGQNHRVEIFQGPQEEWTGPARDGARHQKRQAQEASPSMSACPGDLLERTPPKEDTEVPGLGFWLHLQATGVRRRRWEGRARKALIVISVTVRTGLICANLRGLLAPPTAAAAEDKLGTWEAGEKHQGTASDTSLTFLSAGLPPGLFMVNDGSFSPSQKTVGNPAGGLYSGSPPEPGGQV